MDAHEDLLGIVQDRLAAIYGPAHYYTTHYRKEERGYFGQIPKWISRSCEKMDRNDYILDIGAAYGTLACYCASLCSAEVYTLDVLPYLSLVAANEFHVSRIFGDVERIDPYWPQPSVVILTEVIEHFNFHPLLTVARIHKSMKPGGLLYLSTPDANSSWGRVGPYASLAHIPHYSRFHSSSERADCHIWQYTETEILGILHSGGFAVSSFDLSTSSGGRHFNIEAIA